MIRPTLLTCAVAALAAAAAFACSAPSSDARAVEVTPDRATFGPVSAVLVHRCGTLDCHGTIARNFRLVGSEGRRLAPTDQPLVPACSTAAEIDEDFGSVVGLEPEVMSQVVKDHGANPERLTLVRKALGLEDHAGGAPFLAGDDQDVCLRSWLAGAADRDACVRALPSGTCVP